MTLIFLLVREREVDSIKQENLQLHVVLKGRSQQFSEHSHGKVLKLCASAQPKGLSCLVMWKEWLAKFTALLSKSKD